MIVVDASALVAIARREPDAPQYAAALETASEAFLAAANYVEVGVVLIDRGQIQDQRELDRWLGDLGVVVRDDMALGAGALTTYLRFGKGFHPARLNLADCFAYALAKRLDAPLLYKGDDFTRTDIRSALQPI